MTDTSPSCSMNWLQSEVDGRLDLGISFENVLKFSDEKKTPTSHLRKDC